MLYILLTIIIILLIIIIYSNRDKSAHYGKMFSSIKGIKDFKKDDDRNRTHPNENVKFQLKYMKRHEAVKEAGRLEELYRTTGVRSEDIEKLIYR